MSIGYVIGNGESRKDFDIRKLNNQGATYGCNALMRDYNVQNLVCSNRLHLNEAIDFGLDKKSYVHTNIKLSAILKNPNIQLLPDVPYESTHKNDLAENWKSGSYALLLGAMKNDIVMLLGFDFNGLGERSQTNPFGKINNIYKDTVNYPGSNEKQRDMGPDVQQVGHLMKHFSKVKFIFINDWVPETLLTHQNSFQDTYENLEKQLLTSL